MSTSAPPSRGSAPGGLRHRRTLWWSAWVVGALLLLAVLDGVVYGLVVPASALVLAAVPGALPRSRREIDRTDLAVVAGLYVAVVALLRIAFAVFTVASVTGLFLCFAAGLLLGVVGPVVYTVAVRGRELRSLGLRRDRLGRTAALGIVFAAVQFFLTVYGRPLPAPVDWVPLLVMSLTVGLFESVFFRGFVQTRLETAFGPVPGAAGAAALYALYHVGYGMGGGEMIFLFGLGVVYAVAFAQTRNILVLWPLLTPVGGFYANLTAGEIHLPWLSILGFADVVVVMVVAVSVVAFRARRRAAAEDPPPSRNRE